MEGINHNPVNVKVNKLLLLLHFFVVKTFNDYFMDIDLIFTLLMKDWLHVYSHRRLGKTVKQPEAPWDILHQTIYNCTDDPV